MSLEYTFESMPQNINGTQSLKPDIGMKYEARDL